MAAMTFILSRCRPGDEAERAPGRSTSAADLFAARNSDSTEGAIRIAYSFAWRRAIRGRLSDEKAKCGTLFACSLDKNARRPPGSAAA